ncbi:ASCH domain protein [Gilliamella apicola SCGC AB-598-I20]|nr:ASCH domain protein [Gilliamella apicola SCGC AB-598-I20]
MIYKTLSIMFPAVRNILNGSKKVEIRSWRPQTVPLKNIVLVENHHYLVHEEDCDDGYALAIVDIIDIQPWTKDMFLQQNNETKLNKQWSQGYYVWHLENIRKLDNPLKCIALKGIYEVDLDIRLL